MKNAQSFDIRIGNECRQSDLFSRAINLLLSGAPRSLGSGRTSRMYVANFIHECSQPSAPFCLLFVLILLRDHNDVHGIQTKRL